MDADGYAPSWDVETLSNRRVLYGTRKIPYAFAVGESVTYVQAPEAKGRKNKAV